MVRIRCRILPLPPRLSFGERGTGGPGVDEIACARRRGDSGRMRPRGDCTSGIAVILVPSVASRPRPTRPRATFACVRGRGPAPDAVRSGSLGTGAPACSVRVADSRRRLLVGSRRLGRRQAPAAITRARSGSSASRRERADNAGEIARLTVTLRSVKPAAGRARRRDAAAALPRWAPRSRSRRPRATSATAPARPSRAIPSASVPRAPMVPQRQLRRVVVDLNDMPACLSPRRPEGSIRLDAVDSLFAGARIDVCVPRRASRHLSGSRRRKRQPIERKPRQRHAGPSRSVGLFRGNSPCRGKRASAPSRIASTAKAVSEAVVVVAVAREPGTPDATVRV